MPAPLPLTAAVSILVSAGLAYAGTGLRPVPGVVCLAVLPLLWLAPQLSWWAGGGLAALAWIAGGLNLWTYYLRDLHLPVPAAASFVLLGGVAMGSVAAIFGGLVRGGHPLLATLAAPAVWVSVEYLVAQALPHGSWWSLAYTQAGVPAAMQTAAFGGTAAVSLLIMLLPAAGAAMLHSGWQRSMVLVTGGAIVVAALLGVARLASPERGAPVKVGLVAVGQPEVDAVPFGDTRAASLLDGYLAAMRGLADRGATIIVGPESVFRVTEAQLPRIAEPLAELARSRQVSVVLGVIITGERVRNAALMFGPDGASGQYHKQHLVPGLEDTITPGQTIAMLPGDPSVGVLVCKDLDFTGLVRSYRTAGATILIAPAWDFDRDGWLHSRMAVTRGVEAGVPVVRAARSGLLTVSDAHGRVVAEAPDSPHGTVTLLAEVARPAISTAYTRFSDWLAWLCLLGTLACLVRLIRP